VLRYRTVVHSNVQYALLPSGGASRTSLLYIFSVSSPTDCSWCLIPQFVTVGLFDRQRNIEQETAALLLDVRELWEQFGAGFVRSVSICGSNLCKILPWVVQLYNCTLRVRMFGRFSYLFVILKSECRNYVAERCLLKLVTIISPPTCQPEVNARPTR